MVPGHLSSSKKTKPSPDHTPYLSRGQGRGTVILVCRTRNEPRQSGHTHHGAALEPHLHARLLRPRCYA